MVETVQIQFLLRCPNEEHLLVWKIDLLFSTLSGLSNLALHHSLGEMGK